MLGNKDVMRVAKIGKIFTPVITNVSNRSANIFTLENDGKLYVAVINYSKIMKTFKVDLGDGQYTATELWCGTTEDVSETLEVRLDAKDAAIYELTPKG